MFIGGNRETFYKLTPKSIQVDFKAYNKRKEQEQKEAIQLAWIQGAYMINVLQSTPVILGMSKGSLPKYPEMPFKVSQDEEEEKKKNEEYLKAQRAVLMDMLKRKFHIDRKD